ncbi:hypothetical protein [Pararhizobium sp.]|uniref:hypothetical protein n=1 Tax=Pararhizobium sp. TaxID=1977563 RepID=UPI003D0F76FD
MSMTNGQGELFESDAPTNALHVKEQTIQFLTQNMVRLLNQVGNKDFCKGCGEEVWYVKHKNGKCPPYTADGTNHFANCPNADQFRKKG